MKAISFNHRLMLFIFLMTSVSFFACGEGAVKNKSDTKNLQMCLKNAEKFEKMHGKDEVETGAYLQKAQDYYLCAEKEGNTYAGYKAAGLSDAGVAKRLNEKEVIRLYENSANAGNANAAFEMYLLSCGFEQNMCSDPGAAKSWAIKSATLGNANGFNALGGFYERGYDGTVDIHKAAACYKLADEKGAELAKHNLQRVLKKATSLVKVNCL